MPTATAPVPFFLAHLGLDLQADERAPLLPKSSLMMRHRDRPVHAFEGAKADFGFNMLGCGFLI